MKTKSKKTLITAALLVAFTISALAEEGGAVEEKAAPPPLPFHTIEGYGGGAITPIAYLVNPSPDAGQVFGLPSASYSYVNAGKKSLQAFALTETLWGRLELGYAYNRFGVGTLDDDILDATGIDIERGHVGLHNLNLRVLLLNESETLPAITAGIHYKKNEGIEDIDAKLGGALSSIGLDDDRGLDFTLTASKLFTPAGKPFIVSAGLRSSEASHIGLLGFSDDRELTFEGNVVWIPTSWLLLAYEYRQKSDSYDRIPGLVGREDDWHAIDVSWLINSHATLVAGWGRLGTLANTKENDAWYLQLKYEL
ncbi:MAG: DUF3034 family protein [Opitutales bacterium]|nr:DUF3034 family protein [Opitutales bacterium]